MEYIHWKDSPYSHSISPANPERINGVGDAMRLLGVEPTKDLSLESITVIRNPLQKYKLTDNQRRAITLGANFMKSHGAFEGVADKNLITILEGLGVEDVNQGIQSTGKAIDHLRKKYYEDC